MTRARLSETSTTERGREEDQSLARHLLVGLWVLGTRMSANFSHQRERITSAQTSDASSSQSQNSPSAPGGLPSMCMCRDRYKYAEMWTDVCKDTDTCIYIYNCTRIYIHTPLCVMCIRRAELSAPRYHAGRLRQHGIHPSVCCYYKPPQEAPYHTDQYSSPLCLHGAIDTCSETSADRRQARFSSVRVERSHSSHTLPPSSALRDTCSYTSLNGDPRHASMYTRTSRTHHHTYTGRARQMLLSLSVCLISYLKIGGDIQRLYGDIS